MLRMHTNSTNQRWRIWRGWRAHRVSGVPCARNRDRFSAASTAVTRVILTRPAHCDTLRPNDRREADRSPGTIEGASRLIPYVPFGRPATAARANSGMGDTQECPHGRSSRAPWTRICRQPNTSAGRLSRRADGHRSRGSDRCLAVVPMTKKPAQWSGVRDVTPDVDVSGMRKAETHRCALCVPCLSLTPAQMISLRKFALSFRCARSWAAPAGAEESPP
jgi:hypothetical protein